MRPATPISNHPSVRSPLTRRDALAFLGAAGTTILAACSDSSSTTNDTSAPSAAPTDTAVPAESIGASESGDGEPTPAETSGPFPSDGTNDNGSGGPADVLHDPRAIRRDIRSDLDGSNTQGGVPLTLRTRVVTKSSPLIGAAVYVWHCNTEGAYSGYNSRMLDTDFSANSFLRGVQITDSDGWVEFNTVLPGRYPGRAFHIHFEVFADDSFTSRLLTSQMAVDDELIDSLYADADGYESALAADTDNSRDNVFADGVSNQLLTITGDTAQGLVAEFVTYI